MSAIRLLVGLMTLALAKRLCFPATRSTQANRDNRRAPVQNLKRAQSIATLDHMAGVLKEHNA